jgi:hypothetical protein
MVFSRSNVNIIRKPFLSMAVSGGIANRKKIFCKNEIYFKDIYYYLSDSDGYQYRKVNLQVDSMMMLVVDYDDRLFQEYCHLFEQVHQEVLLDQPEEKNNEREEK